MNHIEFIEKNAREILIKQGFSSSVAQGGAWQAIDLYKRMSQASKKGAIFDDVMRHAKAWADKQVSKTEITKSKRNQPKNQGGLF
ncbi:hypothetical protein [Citrobacter freundii]|uniref:hypothetical protein n=1 Tax=Citrobacter freundii TaxID=546 RepID=UPI0015EC4B06|nr:hypothetical protein [Citrobacter freundii]WNT13316.1 hypothetical protein RRL10_06055 [Citrobacter freundii]HBU6368355.1 hypothetical protein [Citrobacter freundii]HCL6754432.1 hypothetical protein [Citrobacter freundii]